MTLHFHGTPLSPNVELEKLAGACLCVPWKRPDNLKFALANAQQVMIDNSAFSFWRTGYAPNWADYYKWLEPILDYPHTWAIIPDVIGGDETTNKELIINCPWDGLVPVWHLHESLEHLRWLVDNFEFVCFGSSGEYRTPGTSAWVRRVELAFNTVNTQRPRIHMLRGMAVAHLFPFYSVDSTDIARNHKRTNNTVAAMRSRWDRIQSPSWRPDV